MWTTGAPGRRAPHCATEERASSSHRAVVPLLPVDVLVDTAGVGPGRAGPGFGSGGVVVPVAVVALFSLLVFLAADFRAARLFAVPGPWFRGGRLPGRRRGAGQPPRGGYRACRTRVNAAGATGTDRSGRCRTRGPPVSRAGGASRS
ncbi:hypothetical protein GCM10009660_48410 [Catellatospora bangladeshensis]